MSIVDRQPVNKNFLAPHGFNFQIKKSPHVNFFVQSVNLPTFSLGTVDVENPFIKIPFPGDKLSYGTLDVTYKVDENMENYLEIYNWLIAIGYPDNFGQRSNIESKPAMSGEGVYADLSLIILNSQMNPKFEVTFKDAYPISLSELQFDSTITDVDYLTTTVTFAYRIYTISSLS